MDRSTLDHCPKSLSEGSRFQVFLYFEDSNTTCLNTQKKRRCGEKPTKFRDLLSFIYYFDRIGGKNVNFLSSSQPVLFFNLPKELLNLLKDQTLGSFTKVVTMNSFAELSSLLPHCAEIMLTIFPCLPGLLERSSGRGCWKDSISHSFPTWH